VSQFERVSQQRCFLCCSLVSHIPSLAQYSHVSLDCLFLQASMRKSEKVTKKYFIIQLIIYDYLKDPKLKFFWSEFRCLWLCDKFYKMQHIHVITGHCHFSFYCTPCSPGFEDAETSTFIKWTPFSVLFLIKPRWIYAAYKETSLISTVFLETTIHNNKMLCLHWY